MRSFTVYDALQVPLKQAHMLSSAVLAGSGASLLYLLHIYTTSSQKIELAVLNQASIELVHYLLLPSLCFSIATGLVICLAEKRTLFSCHYMGTKGMNALAAVLLGSLLAFGLKKLAVAASDLRGVQLAGWHLEAGDLLAGMNLFAAVLMATILFVLYNVVRRPCGESAACGACLGECGAGALRATAERPDEAGER